jgi:hypothetical protein
VISSGNLWFVNFLPELADHPAAVDDVPTLIFADVLHDFFQTGIKKQQKAIIRLEDVSTHVAPAKLEQISQYLASEKVPFAIGLIPNQRLATGRVDPLGEHLGLVRTLRSAQANGGTIVLHGYFHTFGTGEDYEFWDDVRNQPLTGETHLLYACKASDGIRILRDLGLEPKMWETPHYSGSNLTYEVMGKYFSHALENRRGATWMPYGYGPDKFGQIVIPENIGYISPDPTNKEWTVQKQLERAGMLQIVRDAWVLGFYHPVVIPISALKELVTGLRALGYEFVDLSKLPTEVYYDYKQSKSAERATWLSTSFGVNVRKFERWWNSVRENVTYPLVLLGWLSSTGAAQANVSAGAIEDPFHGKADPRCRYILE